MNYSVSVEGGRVELLESDQPDAYILVVSTDGTFDVYLDPYHLRKVANMFMRVADEIEEAQ